MICNFAKLSYPFVQCPLLPHGTKLSINNKYYYLNDYSDEPCELHGISGMSSIASDLHGIVQARIEHLPGAQLTIPRGTILSDGHVVMVLQDDTICVICA